MKTTYTFNQGENLLVMPQRKAAAKAPKITTAGTVAIDPAISREFRKDAADLVKWCEASVHENPAYLTNAFEALTLLIAEVEDIRAAVSVGNTQEFHYQMRDLSRKSFLLSRLSKNIIGINNRFSSSVTRKRQ